MADSTPLVVDMPAAVATLRQAQQQIAQQQAIIDQFPATLSQAILANNTGYVSVQLQQMFESIVGSASPQMRATIQELMQHLAADDTSLTNLLTQQNTDRGNQTADRARITAAEALLSTLLGNVGATTTIANNALAAAATADAKAVTADGKAVAAQTTANANQTQIAGINSKLVYGLQFYQKFIGLASGTLVTANTGRDLIDAYGLGASAELVDIKSYITKAATTNSVLTIAGTDTTTSVTDTVFTSVSMLPTAVTLGKALGLPDLAGNLLTTSRPKLLGLKNARQIKASFTGGGIMDLYLTFQLVLPTT